jgi:CRISPR/Cas system Type II protein with McrA/HNH and RuvC-like nuclease domain
MPLIDPAKRLKRQARRNERRRQIIDVIKRLWNELDELTDEIEDEIKEHLLEGGAPLNPDTDVSNKMGKG